MASRQETTERKQALLDDLRSAYRDGNFEGDKALSQRALSAQYGLSMQTVGLQLQKLVEEGLLYTVPRVGTFMGRPPGWLAEPYLMVAEYPRAWHSFIDKVQTGFEDRIAELGGSCVTLSLVDTIWQHGADELPRLAGAFLHNTSPKVTSFSLGQPGIPIVMGSGDGGVANDLSTDIVDFDHEDGGMQAVKHLLSMGHRHIGFLPLHHQHDDSGVLGWSVIRESGWRKMLESIGQSTEELVVHPLKTSELFNSLQIASAMTTAAQLLKNSEITAVVAVNHYAAQGLLEMLQQSQIAPERWPAIVCFDDSPQFANSLTSYIRLPWEKFGAEAAQLLWERKTGRLTGPPQRRLVKMHLIPRLSSSIDWARASGLVHRSVVDATNQSEASESFSQVGA